GGGGGEGGRHGGGGAGGRGVEDIGGAHRQAHGKRLAAAVGDAALGRGFALRADLARDRLEVAQQDEARGVDRGGRFGDLDLDRRELGHAVCAAGDPGAGET